MRLSDLITNVKRRLRPKVYACDGPVPVRHMYARIVLDDAFWQQARAEHDADDYKRLAIVNRLMRENGLTRKRAERYAFRAYPIGFAKLYRAEMRAIAKSINEIRWEQLHGQ